MVASNGARAGASRRDGRSGGCDTGSGPIKVDWVMGTRGRVDFSRHVVDYRDPVRFGTDHAFVHARVKVEPPARKRG